MVAIVVTGDNLIDPWLGQHITRELLDRGDLDPALRARLEITEEDDPLELATTRLREDWLLEFGRAFNALAEPLGTSITTFTLLYGALAVIEVGSTPGSRAFTRTLREPTSCASEVVSEKHITSSAPAMNRMNALR